MPAIPPIYTRGDDVSLFKEYYERVGFVGIGGIAKATEDIITNKKRLATKVLTFNFFT